MESILTVQQRGTVRRPMRHIVNLTYGSKVQKSERLGPQGVSFIERLCPLSEVLLCGCTHYYNYVVEHEALQRTVSSHFIE